jgi:DNA-binding NtrC family response regulator
MASGAREERQPWVSCFLTDILISHIAETYGKNARIDCAGLFRGLEGFEVPEAPEAFLREATNWVPLSVLRELHAQCERISGQKDIAYRAARAYFDPGKEGLLSLFEIVFRVLSDVRSVLVCSSLWAGVQTNYLQLQSFEKPGRPPSLYMLARFDEKARPMLGSMHMLRGLAEGFPRLYSPMQDGRCVEEISQLQIEDIVGEFPDFAVLTEENHLAIRHRASHQVVVEAARIPLRSETVAVPPDFPTDAPESRVVSPANGALTILTNLEEEDPRRRSEAAWGYRIVRNGVLTSEGLSHAFEVGQVFNAPYSRLRFLWREGASPAPEVSVEEVRREVSRLLFEHLKEVKHAQTRMIQYSIEKQSLSLENIRLRREVEREYSFGGLVGQSPKMQELFGVIRSLAETDVSVLIRGETGTGKELIARAIHYNSPRRAKRFVAVNCGALVETLLESELFGHEKGAFTGAISRRQGVFELADGGTLFLDEIGEISPSTQVRLLRVLQEGEFQRVGGTAPIRVDVRVLSATNQNLEELVRIGRFRQDLYYRLNILPIQVPPLRERRDDIPLLIPHFIQKCNRRLHRQIRGVSPRAAALLMGYSWPGNVRELENMIQRMGVLAKGETLDLEDLPSEFRGHQAEPASRPGDLKDLARESTELVERRAILDALSASGGNVTRAAKALGISRATLQKRMKAYALRDPKP